MGGLGGYADGGRGREYTYCYTVYYHVMLKVTVKKEKRKGASKLVFYAQSTSAVISGQERKGEKNKSHSYRTKTNMLKETNLPIAG